ncbi:NirD/YgiW/YdeI family stress tolerance protein [Pseudoruegeria sp. HB172150]|uniref:NirD/YgiW/YdeI family stress tolerance protein n=1 Tax=Pseudoruegeria sp. HB172150 TaxID=2721164 RepID=UPI001C12D50A|nr:NirD/YgiW/YdeI family stress tolerance protein [Pseudoruegeria sp. HB172150]
MHFLKRFVLTLSLAIAAPGLAKAQFTGPTATGAQMTVQAAQSARISSYVTLEGNIVSHLRSDYYLFRDASGEIQVEIPQRTFGGQEVSPDTPIRIVGEVDRRIGGQRYIWVKSLQVL